MRHENYAYIHRGRSREGRKYIYFFELMQLVMAWFITFFSHSMEVCVVKSRYIGKNGRTS